MNENHHKHYLNITSHRITYMTPIQVVYADYQTSATSNGCVEIFISHSVLLIPLKTNREVRVKQIQLFIHRVMLWSNITIRFTRISTHSQKDDQAINTRLMKRNQ